MAQALPIALDDLQPGDELLQSALWGRFKQRFGWHPQAVSWQAAGSGGTLLALTRPTPFGLLAYVPGAPAAAPATGDPARVLAELAPRIALPRAGAAARRPALVRYDLPWPAAAVPLTGARLYRAPVDVQPTSTVLVDLLEDEARLLARMKPKTRYNIRLAQRRGVTVAVLPAAAARGRPLADWYRLYRATAARHRITTHSERYFAALFELAAAAAAPELFLLSAGYRDELLGGIVVSICGRMGRYLYGASAPRRRELMANYALQWAALRLARERGCHTYDLYGIPPAADPSHPWFGLYQFKTGFGGAIVHRRGCWDYALQPLSYRLLRQGELLRRRYYGQVRPLLVRLRNRAAGALRMR